MKARWRRGTGAPPATGDQGSMIVAVAIIMIVTLLGSTIAARAVGGAFVSSYHQDSASAVSAADAGLADAVYRISQGSVGTGGANAFCVAQADARCIAASVPAVAGVSYFATEVSATDWLVRSLATVKGRAASVEGHVTRSAEYPFALFGVNSLDFNGTTGQSFSTYVSTSPSGATNPDPAGALMVGSDGSVTCHGSLGSAVTVEYFGAAGVASTGTSDCGIYRRSTTRFPVTPPSTPSGALACPGTGPGSSELGSGFAGAPSLLAGGTYLCTGPLTIAGLLQVGGPVQLYVILDKDTYGAATPAVTISPGSYVNDQADYCAAGGTSGCGARVDLPNSADLQIFTDSTGTIGSTGASGFHLGGIIYAPGASLSGDACSSTYYGAVVIGALNCVGAAQLSVSYDTSLATLYGPWLQSGYTEISPEDYAAALAAAGL